MILIEPIVITDQVFDDLHFDYESDISQYLCSQNKLPYHRIALDLDSGNKRTREILDDIIYNSINYN